MSSHPLLRAFWLTLIFFGVWGQQTNTIWSVGMMMLGSKTKKPSTQFHETSNTWFRHIDVSCNFAFKISPVFNPTLLWYTQLGNPIQHKIHIISPNSSTQKKKNKRNNVTMSGLERHDVPRMSNLPFCRSINSKNRWKCWGMCSIVWIQQHNPPPFLFFLGNPKGSSKAICSKNTHFRIQIWRKWRSKWIYGGQRASQP